MAGERLSLAHRIATSFEEHGAEILWIEDPAALASVETLLYLSPMKQDPTATDLKALFELSKAALDSGVQELIGVTRLSTPAQLPTEGGSSAQSAGAGIPGLLKSLAKEWPEARVCCVDVDHTETEGEVAAKLVSELHADDAQVEVAYTDGQRQKVTYVPSEPPRSDVAPISLSSSSVVLITGGARGITAHIARHVAERFGCHLVLVGRSPIPQPEDPRLQSADTLTKLRARLAGLGELSSPRDIETKARRVMHAREIQSTLSDIEAAGATVEYRSLDVRDESELESLIAELYARYDRLDGVIHGAGVIEDRLLRDKSRDSFERVVDTKAAGARVIARAIRDDIRFVVFFSSVSAAFGNRGQTDYAAANDILDKLATQMNERLSGRVVSIAWGPWASAGMVSEELEAEYRRRGIGLISPSDGVARFMDELARGEEAEPQVVWMCATPVEMAG